jgi:hypothetical protein
MINRDNIKFVNYKETAKGKYKKLKIISSESDYLNKFVFWQDYLQIWQNYLQIGETLLGLKAKNWLVHANF